MTTYEIVIALVAITNLTLTLLALLRARSMAATSRINALEEDLRRELKAHTRELNEMKVATQGALSREHLDDVYGDLKNISQQVHQMVGQQSQMNELLRQLVGQQLRHG
jgi:predicted GTPase